MKVEQVMPVSIVCAWSVGGKLFKEAFEPKDLILVDAEAVPVIIGAQVYLDGAGPLWTVESFEGSRAVCSRLNSAGLRYEGKFPVESLSTAAK